MPRTGATCLQDCAVIASAFERGAHHTASEPAVFAPLTRGVQATKNFAVVNQKAVGSWERRHGGSTEGERVGTATGTISPDGLPIGTDERGDPPWQETTAGRMARDCLPCIDRIINNLTWRPEEEFLDLLLFDIKNRLDWLKNIENLLGQQSLQGAYGDLCALLAFLNNMCILDLQKILWLLSMMNMDFSINLNGLLPMLRSLIAPLIAPPLANLNSILEQITQLVLAPIDCIIQALDLLIRDLDLMTATGQVLSERFQNAANWRSRANSARREGASQADQRAFSQRYTDERATLQETVRQSGGGDLSARERTILDSTTSGAAATGATGGAATSTVGASVGGGVAGAGAVFHTDPVIADILAKSNTQEERRFAFTNSLVEIRDQLIRARTKLEAKLLFYRRVLAALLGQWKSLDDEYFQLSINKLINIRLISLIASIIKAKSSGKDLCAEDQTPTDKELNTFLDTFLNPNSPLQLRVDEEGNLIITEPITQEDTVSELPNRTQVLGLTQEPLVQTLGTPVLVKLPCKLRTSTEDADKINRWMTELISAPS